MKKVVNEYQSRYEDKKMNYFDVFDAFLNAVPVTTCVIAGGDAFIHVCQPAGRGVEGLVVHLMISGIL